MPEHALRDHMVWVDLEMTGLDPDRDVIIEAAVLITDGELNIVAHGPELAIHRGPEEIALMDAWNRRTHGESGLTERVRRSDTSIEQAEDEILEFLAEWTLERARRRSAETQSIRTARSSAAKCRASTTGCTTGSSM